MRHPRSIASRAPLVAMFVLVCALGHPTDVSAQLRARPGNVELGGGLAFVGARDLDALEATMTSNQPGTPDRLRFFKMDSRAESSRALAGWVGVNVTPVVGIEVGFQRSRPAIRTQITDDAEGVPSATLKTESISQDVIEGNVILHANRGRFDGQKTVPFVLLGGGYLRHVDDEQGLRETGRLYQVGLGFKWVSDIAPSGRARGPGIRLDVRYVFREGGFDVREKARRSFLTIGTTALIAF